MGGPGGDHFLHLEDFKGEALSKLVYDTNNEGMAYIGSLANVRNLQAQSGQNRHVTRADDRLQKES